MADLSGIHHCRQCRKLWVIQSYLVSIIDLVANDVLVDTRICSTWRFSDCVDFVACQNFYGSVSAYWFAGCVGAGTGGGTDYRCSISWRGHGHAGWDTDLDR
jgi:hypothetical protein